jgi:hypothetical protein
MQDFSQRIHVRELVQKSFRMGLTGDGKTPKLNLISGNSTVRYKTSSAFVQHSGIDNGINHPYGFLKSKCSLRGRIAFNG